ncbi:MAG: hypothetical protein EXQ60_01555 [Candidatus Nanopelagicales bacterium]|nr:hypothetical protein [Candidatus Nanopelagicales bacterium]
MTVLDCAPVNQLPLPLDWQVALGIDSPPTVPRHLHLVGAPTGTDAAGQPETNKLPIAWVARMARAVSEVGIGDRPPGQLTRWVERGQLAQLAERGAAVRRHPSTRTLSQQKATTRTLKQVRSIRICQIADGIAETSAVLVGSDRARAVAMRFEFISERWLVTAVNLG